MRPDEGRLEIWHEPDGGWRWRAASESGIVRESPKAYGSSTEARRAAWKALGWGDAPPEVGHEDESTSFTYGPED